MMTIFIDRESEQNFVEKRQNKLYLTVLLLMLKLVNKLGLVNCKDL